MIIIFKIIIYYLLLFLIYFWYIIITFIIIIVTIITSTDIFEIMINSYYLYSFSWKIVMCFCFLYAGWDSDAAGKQLLEVSTVEFDYSTDSLGSSNGIFILFSEHTNVSSFGIRWPTHYKGRT